MNYRAVITFLRFIQRVQLLAKKAGENGEIHSEHDIRRCVEVVYQMSFDKHGNILVDR